MNLSLITSQIGIISGAARLLAVGIMTLTALSSSLKAQTVLLYDDFTGSPQGSSPARSPQTNNSGIPTNNWAWQTGATYLENSVISAVTGEDIGGRLALNAPTALTTASITTQLNTGISTPVNWVGVGFAASTASSPWYLNGSGGLIWGLLTPTGNWSLMLNGVSTYLASGTYVGDLSSSISLSIQYDPLTTNAALIIGGTNVSGWFSTGISANAIGAAGFTDQAATTSDPRSVYVNSFSVTAVPEPSAIILTALGLGGVWLSRRRTASRSTR